MIVFLGGLFDSGFGFGFFWWCVCAFFLLGFRLWFVGAGAFRLEICFCSWFYPNLHGLVFYGWVFVLICYHVLCFEVCSPFFHFKSGVEFFPSGYSFWFQSKGVLVLLWGLFFWGVCLVFFLMYWVVCVDLWSPVILKSPQLVGVGLCCVFALVAMILLLFYINSSVRRPCCFCFWVGWLGVCVFCFYVEVGLIVSS